MKELMLVLSFVIGYPLFMVFAFLLMKVIFPTTDKVVSEQQRERNLLQIKAKRMKRIRTHEVPDARMMLTQ